MSFCSSHKTSDLKNEVVAEFLLVIDSHRSVERLHNGLRKTR